MCYFPAVYLYCLLIRYCFYHSLVNKDFHIVKDLNDREKLTKHTTQHMVIRWSLCFNEPIPLSVGVLSGL